jgi:hypothetical protein
VTCWGRGRSHAQARSLTLFQEAREVSECGGVAFDPVRFAYTMAGCGDRSLALFEEAREVSEWVGFAFDPYTMT